MSFRNSASAILFGYLFLFSTSFAIDVTTVTGPGDAFTLANMLDGSPEITVNAANFNIDLSSGGTQSSNFSGIGTFSNGNDVTGFPPINQPATGGPISYTGGIGIDAGVCLCTGLVNDSDPAGASATTGSGVGVQGPNNGFPLSQITPLVDGPNGFQSEDVNAGESSFRLQTCPDDDFVELINEDNISGDATVLQFDITVSAPGYLRISFVIATDENPAWIFKSPLGDFNDSVGIFVRKNTISSKPFENIAKIVVGENEQPMSLQELDNCGEPIFFNNQIAPSPTGVLSTAGNGVGELQSSYHGFDNNGDRFNLPNDNEHYYNHEFGGFSKKLTRETPCVLAPGTYTVKIVIQDVDDLHVDSAVFLESNSLDLFDFLKGDADLDGLVGQGDLDAVLLNWGESGNCYTEGDLDGDGLVGQGDLDLVLLNWGDMNGNKNFCADFNRDGVVDSADQAILTQYKNVLFDCASRFEGDANGDGKVDNADQTIYNTEVSTGDPSGMCPVDCCSGQQRAMAGSGGESAVASEALVEAHLDMLDIDLDADFDDDDISLWKSRLGGAKE